VQPGQNDKVDSGIFAHLFSSFHFQSNKNINDPLITQTFLILISLEKIEEEYERMKKK
jgi:hypothetical protein